MIPKAKLGIQDILGMLSSESQLKEEEMGSSKIEIFHDTATVL